MYAMKKREVFEIAYKEVDLGGDFERILFLVNKTKSHAEKFKPPPPPSDGVPVLIY